MHIDIHIDKYIRYTCIQQDILYVNCLFTIRQLTGLRPHWFLPLSFSLLRFLCVTQCLAHVEAFIDFSEDELIEDGVLNQGMYTLCPRCWRKITEQSSLGLSEWDERGSEDCPRREECGCLSCLDLQLAIVCVCRSVGRRQRHQTTQKTISFRKWGEKARGTVDAFVLPSKPTSHFAHRNSTVSSTVQSNCFVCAQVSHAHSVCKGECVFVRVCAWGMSPLSLSPVVWHCQKK